MRLRQDDDFGASRTPGRATGQGSTALPAFDLIIFDCDGVLIDSEPIAARTMAEAVQRAGFGMTAREAHLRFTGSAASDCRRVLVEEYGVADIDALFEDWDRALYEAFESSLGPVAGIEAVVAALSCRVCVASNSTVARLRRSLGLLPLWHRFAPHIFSAESVARPKPFPDLVEHAITQMGARPGHTLMIDDSAHGIEAALAAGARAIGFVDPADPRPGRREALITAGAESVAVGAAELPALIAAASGTLLAGLAPS